MAKLETVMKEAIARGARRQVRVLVLPLRREVMRLRRRVGELQGTLTTLRRSAAQWERRMDAAPPIPPVSPEEAKAARFSPRLVQSLRKRLGLSQMALARLVGVSAAALAHWEAGNSVPTGQDVPVDLTPGKLAAAQRILATTTATETIETALDMVVFRRELLDGTRAILGVRLTPPDGRFRA